MSHDPVHEEATITREQRPVLFSRDCQEGIVLCVAGVGYVETKEAQIASKLAEVDSCPAND